MIEGGFNYLDTSMELPKMGDDWTRDEALQNIGKDLELGQPQLEENPTQVNEDLQLFDSITPLSPAADSLSSGPQTNDRKRKGIVNQCECQSTEAENEHSCMAKQDGDSTSKKKEIVREARNLSERKRRGKISEQFQQLQELCLVPQGSKASQASILEGAVTYMKSTKVLLEMLAKMSPDNAKAIAQFYACKFV
ncbi:uncharacterized protein LOC141683045 [Apium graveolens]|uniref:uncharacterized protein LOC141683045 n=1 Tax=Apium graveolens TaxID=4045 RepID=UPI003D79132D